MKSSASCQLALQIKSALSVSFGVPAGPYSSGQQRKYFDREYRRVHTYRARDGFVTLNQYTIREEIDAYATEMQDLHHRVRESPVYASTWAE